MLKFNGVESRLGRRVRVLRRAPLFRSLPSKLRIKSWQLSRPPTIGENVKSSRDARNAGASHVRCLPSSEGRRGPGEGRRPRESRRAWPFAKTAERHRGLGDARVENEIVSILAPTSRGQKEARTISARPIARVECRFLSRGAEISLGRQSSA